MKILKTLLGCTTALAMSTAAYATDLEVTHWWTSGGEAAAVAEFANAFNAGGDKWVDGAIAGSGGVARPIIISRILTGDSQLTRMCAWKPLAYLRFNSAISSRCPM